MPGDTVTLEALCPVFAHSVLELNIPSAGDLAADPSMPGKLRGALGAVLKNSASDEAVAGEPCPWSPPCALDLLFRAQGMMTAGLEIPKPFVLSLAPHGPDLRVRCTLFGLAAEWTGQIGEALVAAMRQGLRHVRGGMMQVSARQASWHEGVGPWPVVAGPCRIEMEFLTPFVLRKGRQTHAALPALITGIGNRASGLARWMGLEVQADWRAIKAAAQALSVVQSSVEGETWLRASRRQGAIIGMEGFRGRAVIEGELGPLMPLFVLGQVTHAGAHAALGMGRYQITDVRGI